jgi:putative ABC transport system permease protein
MFASGTIYHMNSVAYLETAWQDSLYALRTMRKNPLFAMTAVLTLAMGIGGNTALFTVIRAVLLKPLEYRDPDRLVRVSVNLPNRPDGELALSLDRLQEIRETVRSFSEFGAFGRPENMALSGSGEPEALKVARVSANFLSILGVEPILGRSFLPEEDTRGGRPVALIGAGLWKRRFGGDPMIAGKTATLETTPYTIIGVLPAGFSFPFAGADVWVTRPSEWSALPSRYWSYVPILTGFARLKAQGSQEQARAELDVLLHQYTAAHQEWRAMYPGASMRVVLLRDQMVANVRPMLWMLFGAVGFVLLIACANVASLLLARAASRSREFAVRAALGAARGRLIWQLLVESLMLATLGGALGVLLAAWGLRVIAAASALPLPRAGGIRLDGMVLAFTVAISVATGVLFGLFPSLAASRPDLADVLRESGAAAGRGSFTRRGGLGVSARSLLVVGQVGLSIVLLIGAALLIQSFARLHSVNPGFQPANLLTMKIALPIARYDTDQKRAAFFESLVRRVEAAPGVRAVTVVFKLPTTTRLGTDIHIAGRPDSDSEPQIVQLQSITPGYLRTLGIALKRGRELTARDNTSGSPPVVMINEGLARRFWPDYPRGQDPVGQRVSTGFDKAIGWMEIVGIMADVHDQGLALDAEQTVYLPTAVHPPQVAYLAARTEGDPRRFVNTVRSQVLAVDGDQPVSDVRTMDEVIDASIGQRRLTMLLLGSFAGVALLLAMVGIYGVIAYSVAQRTREVGIRRALGAQHGDILRLVLGQGLGLSLAGVAIGIGGAFALTRVMKGFLFQVSATDPTTIVGVALLFVVVALVASYIPARRATRIDPMAALRVG